MTDVTEKRAAVERALMDRARAQASREHERPNRLLQHSVALVAALALVAVVMLGFNAFLTAMQKFMEIKVEEPAPATTAPMPAFVVQPEVSPPPPADQGPRPSPAQAPDTSPANP
jgi:hypothetical protein